MGRICKENASAVEAFLIGTGCLIAIAVVIWWAMASAHFETNRVPPYRSESSLACLDDANSPSAGVAFLPVPTGSVCTVNG